LESQGEKEAREVHGPSSSLAPSLTPLSHWKPSVANRNHPSCLERHKPREGESGVSHSCPNSDFRAFSWVTHSPGFSHWQGSGPSCYLTEISLAFTHWLFLVWRLGIWRSPAIHLIVIWERTELEGGDSELPSPQHKPRPGVGLLGRVGKGAGCLPLGPFL
jgi:hypothetical protein